MMKRFLILIIFISFAVVVKAQKANQYELNSIEFSGNSTFSSSSLQDIIYSEPTPMWFWKFLNSFTSLGKAPVYFDSAFIQIDLNALKKYYNDNGFFNAKFSYKYSVDTADKEVDLTYIIHEGSPATYGKQELIGLTKVPDLIKGYVYNDFHLDTTQRFYRSTVEQNTSVTINTLQNSGYMLAMYDSTIVFRDTSKDKANVNVYFTPGNRYKIDTVLVDKQGPGAPYVNNQLLRDITGIRSGEYYDQESLKRSQLRLYRTGLFSTVLLSGDRNDTVDSKVPIKLEGTIGELNELSPEIIVNNQQNAFNVGLGAAYIRKNFLGDARKLTLSTSFGVQDIIHVDFGNLIKRFSFRDTTLLGYVDSRITIDQPYLFNRPIFGTWETYATINKQANYNNTLYGTKLTFDFELPTYTFINHLSASYNVEQSNEVYRIFNDSLSTKLISVIGADFGSTTADNILFPTTGYNLTVHLEEANSIPYLISKIGGNNYEGSMFYKVVLNSSYYFPLDRKRNKIFAAKFKVGNLQTYYGDFAGVPLNRTFYAGGSNSIRGWRSNELVPAGSDSVRSIQGINIKGGSFLLEGSIEYRYRFMQNIGTVFFADLGNTWLNYHRFTFAGVAIAAGIGLRYYTQIAPFRIDFAFKFYDPGDQKYIFKKPFWKNIQIQFGIGEAF